MPSPDDPHTDKNIVAEQDNYWQIKKGEVFATKIIQVLRSHPNATINKPVKDAITQEVLSRIQRMSNGTFMADVSSRLQEDVWVAGPLWLPLLQMYVMEKKQARKKIDGEPFGRLTACCITEESHVLLTDCEKNLIYEANIANPPTFEVISKKFKNPTDVSFIREKPQHLLVCASLGIGRFCLSSRKTSRSVVKDIG